jgi:hypothetical protein
MEHLARPSTRRGGVVMPNPSRSTRHPLWLTLAAAAALVGSGALLFLGTKTEGVQGAAGVAGLGLYALVILLALSGIVLGAMAGKELLLQRRQSHLG